MRMSCFKNTAHTVPQSGYLWPRARAVLGITPHPCASDSLVLPFHTNRKSCINSEILNGRSVGRKELALYFLIIFFFAEIAASKSFLYEHSMNSTLSLRRVLVYFENISCVSF